MLKHFMLSVLLSVLFTGVIGSGSSRAESDCPVRNCNTREEIKAIVKVFNNYIVSKNLGFTFECENPESTSPMLRCYIWLNREYCLENEYKLEWILRSISVDWNIYTDNKEVGMYDDNKILVFRINSKGVFVVIGKIL